MIEKIPELLNSLDLDYGNWGDSFQLEMEKKNALITKHISLLKEVNKVIGEAKHSFQQEIIPLDKEINEKKRELESISTTITNSLSSYENKKKVYESTISDQNTTININDDKIQRIQKIIESINSEKSELSNNIISLHTEHRNSEIRVKKINSEIDQLEKEKISLKESLGILSNEEDVLKTSIRTKREDVGILESRISALKK